MGELASYSKEDTKAVFTQSKVNFVAQPCKKTCFSADLILPDFGPDVVVLAPAQNVLPRDSLVGTVVYVGHHQVADILQKFVF